MTQDNIYERRRYIGELLNTSVPDVRALAKQWQCSPSAIINDIKCVVSAKDGCTIYGLRDPETGVVRYIGQTDGDPYYRHYRHLAMTRRGRERNKPKAEWIARLIAKGKEPALVILERCSLDRLNEREQWWIKHYLSQGIELVNAIGNPRRRAGERQKGRTPA